MKRSMCRKSYDASGILVAFVAKKKKILLVEEKASQWAPQANVLDCHGNM